MLRRELRQDRERRLEIGRRRVVADAALQSLDRLQKALVANRLHQIVGRRALERVDRVLVVRRHENDMDVGARTARHLESGQPGHANVEERHVGVLGGEQHLLLGTVRSDAGNHEIGPQRREAAAQIFGEPRFVIGDDRRDLAFAAHRPAASIVTSPAPASAAIDNTAIGSLMVTRDPCGNWSSMVNVAASP